MQAPGTNAAQAPPASTFHPIDSGPRTGAAGTASGDATGATTAYVVASGDTLIDISFRFGVDVTELVNSSGTRFDYGYATAIQPGEVIAFKAAPLGHQ